MQHHCTSEFLSFQIYYYRGAYEVNDKAPKQQKFESEMMETIPMFL